MSFATDQSFARIWDVSGSSPSWSSEVDTPDCMKLNADLFDESETIMSSGGSRAYIAAEHFGWSTL